MISAQFDVLSLVKPRSVNRIGEILIDDFVHYEWMKRSSTSCRRKPLGRTDPLHSVPPQIHPSPGSSILIFIIRSRASPSGQPAVRLSAWGRSGGEKGAKGRAGDEPGPPSWDILTCLWLRARGKRDAYWLVFPRGVSHGTWQQEGNGERKREERTLWIRRMGPQRRIRARVQPVAIDALWINLFCPCFSDTDPPFPSFCSLTYSLSSSLFPSLSSSRALIISHLRRMPLAGITTDLYARRISRRAA